MLGKWVNSQISIDLFGLVEGKGKRGKMKIIYYYLLYYYKDGGKEAAETLTRYGLNGWRESEEARRGEEALAIENW